MESAAEYSKRRQTLNELLLSQADLSMKRFLALDHDVYGDGALPKKTKELLGLVASTVLRCDDCISYHLTEAAACGLTNEEIIEALGIALVVGGSVTIPHLRHAMAFLDTIVAPEHRGQAHLDGQD
jgi:ribonuclease HI